MRWRRVAPIALAFATPLPAPPVRSRAQIVRALCIMADPPPPRSASDSVSDTPIQPEAQNTSKNAPRHGPSEAATAKRRSRPPLSYTDDFATPTAVSLDVIGIVRSPYKERFGTPRQPNVTANTLGNCMQPARLELFDTAKPSLSLRGLADFEYVWIVSFFHLNQGFAPLVTPPRGPRKKQGVFATRSPHRPNSVGLSCVRVTGVDVDAGVVHLLGVDLLDGTAALDIKPYVPYCDAFPDAKAGWLDALKEDMKAPDVLSYHPPPAHLMRPVSVPEGPHPSTAGAEPTEEGPGPEPGAKVGKSDQSGT